MKIFYHYTTKDNLEKINSSNKLVNNGQGIYVCESLDDAELFTHYRTPLIKLNKDGSIKEVIQTPIEDLVIIKFIADELEFIESDDHNKDFIKAKAFVSYNDNVRIKVIDTYNFK